MRVCVIGGESRVASAAQPSVASGSDKKEDRPGRSGEANKYVRGQPRLKSPRYQAGKAKSSVPRSTFLYIHTLRS